MSKTIGWCHDKTRLGIWDKQVFCVNRIGDKSWWLNGKRHRVNGPAIEWFDWDKSWWLNGKRYSESDYWKVLKI